MDTDKAEELASRISFDVYVSLLKIDSVYNIDGYVYRVAHNVYARFVNEEVKGRHISIDDAGLPYENDLTNAFVDKTLTIDKKPVYGKIEYDCNCKPKYPVDAWQASSCFDDRSGNLEDYIPKGREWNESLSMDYGYLYEYMIGKITMEPVHADKFKRLFDKGYLVNRGDSEYVNMVVTTLSKDDFTNIFPAIPDEIRAICKEVDNEVFTIRKTHYPPHMQELCRIRFSNCLALDENVVRVLEQLTAAGTLKPLSAVQKHTVNTIMFCDMLPS